MLTTADVYTPQDDIDVTKGIAEFLHTEAASKLDENEQHELLMYLMKPDSITLSSHIQEVVYDFQEWLSS